MLVFIFGYKKCGDLVQNWGVKQTLDMRELRKKAKNARGFAFAGVIVVLSIFACKSNKDSAGNVVKRDAPRSQLLAGVKITAMRIDQFPKYALDGEQWDAYAPFAADPDVYMTISYDHVQLFKSEVLQERAFGTAIDLKAGLPWSLKPFDKPLLIEIFDEDGVTSNDNMGYFLFNPMDYRDWKFVSLKANDRELTISMALEWVYQ